MNHRWVGLLLVGIVLFTAPTLGQARSEQTTSLRIVDVLGQPDTPEDSGVARLKVRVTSGPLSGRTFEYSHQLWGHPLYDPSFKTGNSFVAQLTVADGTIQRVQLGQNRKDTVLLLLFVALTLGLILVGGWEGLIGLFCSLATLAGVLFVFFPLIFTRPVVLVSGLVLCFLTIVITVPLVLMFTRPVLPSVTALTAVTVLVFGLAHWGMEYLQLNPDEARHSRLIMTYLNRAAFVDLTSLRPLLIVGIVLGTLGAMMDVSVVISSTVHEIMRDGNDTSLTEGFESGMRVGREILSTMVNTLIFAYLGVLLPMLLALQIYEISWLNFMNYSFIGVEILRINVGLIGLSLIIPATSLLSAWWFSR